MDARVRQSVAGPRGWLAAVVAAVAVVGLLVVAPTTSSSEAFPGVNGKIAYVKAVDDTWEVTQIWSMDPDATNQVQLTDPSDGATDDMPQWSPDGTKIVFQREDAESVAVWIMDADGSGETQLTPDSAEAGGGTWSPDGSKIVYTAWPDPNTGSGPALFVMNSDGSGQTQLTTDNDWDRWASWSPDGSRIALTRDDPESGATEIWLIDADGSNPVQLTDSGDPTIQSFGPSWSPDGSRLTYLHRVGNDYYNYVMNADGTDQQSISGPGSGVGQWSPDGQLIAFTNNTGTDAGIWTMGPDGSDKAPLLVGLVYGPAWQRVTVPVNPTTTTTTSSTSSTTTGSVAAAVTPRFTG